MLKIIKNKLILVVLIFSSNISAFDMSVGLDGTTVFKEPVMGFWFSGGPVLFGIKTSLGPRTDQDREEVNSLDYGPNNYLNNKNRGHKSIMSYNLNFDIMYLINPKSRLNVFIGGYYSTQEYCPTYWTSDIDYFYRCPKWENKKQSGLDLRVHYDIFKNEKWAIPLAISTTSGGDMGIGIGWKWSL